MVSQSLTDLSTALLDACRRRGLRLALAESCTGGLVAGCLTAVAGSSDVVDRGFVTYSNEAKTEMLGVPAALIAQHGAVSAEVAAAMAAGALARSGAEIAVSVTGVAGPGGGTVAKPVGLVFIGVAGAGIAQPAIHRHEFAGNRDAVRHATVESAIGHLLRLVGPDGR